MKKVILLVLAMMSLGLSAHAQGTLYQWDFRNGDGVPVVDGGNGTMSIVPVTGVDPGTVSFSSIGGPWNTNGCYLVAGQGYNTGNTVVGTSTNLSGIGTMTQITLTFWFKFGASVTTDNGGVGAFPRFVQLGATNLYDAGGKGPIGNKNGIGTSINGWENNGTGLADQVQNGVANAGGGANPQPVITNSFPALTNDVWYFEAVTYDGNSSAQNFVFYLGTTNVAATNVATLSQNLGSISFGNNATIMLGNDEIATAARALSSGGIADVRVIDGIVSLADLNKVRLLQTNFPPRSPQVAVVAQPKSGSTYLSGSRTFSVGVKGAAPFAYQWKHAGTNLPSATNSTLTVNNVQAVNAGSYSVTVTNVFGSTNSITAVLTALTAPAGSYAAAVLARQPFSYWHLDDVNTNANPNTPVVINDYVAGRDGFAGNPTNTLFGVSGPPYTGFPTFNAALGVISNGTPSLVSTPPLPGYSNTMSFVGWVYTRGYASPGGLIMSRDPQSGNGYGDCWGLEFVNDSNSAPNQLGAEWRSDIPGYQNTTFLTNGVGLYVPTNEWTFIAMRADPFFSSVQIYVGDSHTNLQNMISSGTIFESGPHGGSLVIGYDPIGSGGGFPDTRFCNASFSDVAVYYNQLSDADITALYQAGLGSGKVLALKASASGSNIVVQWTTGTLQQASSPAGPWTNVSGAMSPYTVPTTGAIQLFRAKLP